MRGALLLIALLLPGTVLFAQTIYTIRADSTKLTGCDSNELIIENHTQGVPGFLYNTGRGRTQFRRGIMKINGGLYLIGGDTLNLGTNAWIQGGNSFGTTGVLGTLDNNHLDIYTNDSVRGRWTNTGNLLIGTTTDNGSLLQVNGSSYFNGPQQITGTAGGTANVSHTLFFPTVTGAAGDWNALFGTRIIPTMNCTGDYQQAFAMDINPTYNLNGYIQHTDGISAALHVGSNLGGIRIDQSTSYGGDTGQPLFISQGGGVDKEAILNYRNSSPTVSAFIWNRDGRPQSNLGAVVPALRSTVPGGITAGGGVSFTMDRFYYGTEAAINMLYDLSPAGDTASTIRTSISFNTLDQGIPYTPLYINGSKIGIGINSPTAQLHTTGTVCFAGLTSDTTQSRVLVSDANGNLYYRDISSLTMAGALHSDLAYNENVTGRSTRLSGIHWPDYVFAPGYRFPTLKEVENYIHQYHHLPGIPSAEEAERDGVDAGENQKALLKKVEELTLYTIQQDKELQSLKNEIKELKEMISAKENVHHKNNHRQS